MITQRQRKFVMFMLKLRLWSIRTMMRLPDIHAMLGTHWILKRLKERQSVDNYHHAPCCPANHYHKERIVFHPCNCGAVALGKAGKA